MESPFFTTGGKRIHQGKRIQFCRQLWWFVSQDKINGVWMKRTSKCGLSHAQEIETNVWDESGDFTSGSCIHAYALQ